MQIFHSLDEMVRESAPSTVTVGAFDGIHCAHQELLRRVRERAREKGCASIAVTFDPHPAAVLAPDRAPLLLTPLPLKLELIERSGIDRVLILPFTMEFSRWSPQQFVEEVIVSALRAETVFVGDNFRFGHRQAGNPQLLQELGERCGFQTAVLKKMSLRGQPVSSSQIRKLLEMGDVNRANRLLGYPFTLRAPVVTGSGIGRRQTVPTFNLEEPRSLLPQPGVYITAARLLPSEPGQAYASSDFLPAVTNVGYRPTFGQRELGVETHLLEAWSGAPPEEMEVCFRYRLRDEKRFESAAGLREQILRDIGRAHCYFLRLRRAGIPFGWRQE